jgi:Protein of unknown function (DUF664)
VTSGSGPSVTLSGGRLRPGVSDASHAATARGTTEATCSAAAWPPSANGECVRVGGDRERSVAEHRLDRLYGHADAAGPSRFAPDVMPADRRRPAPKASRARERRRPTLHTLLAHMIVVTGRHTGHADIIREAIDGAAGLLPGLSNPPDEADATAWKEHDDKLETIARSDPSASP